MNKMLLLINFLLAFNTVNAQIVYFVETFESGEAQGWTIEDQWQVGDLTELWGLYGGNINNTEVLGFDDYQAGQNHIGGGRAISPTIDLTAASGPLFLEINVKFRNVDQFGIDEQFKLFISTDNGGTWVEFIEFQELDWEKMIYDFDQFAGESVLLAFDYTDGSGYNIGAAVDDIAISDELVFTLGRDYTLTVDGGAIFNECAQNIDYPITGVVLNNGLDEITSFDIEVVNGSEVNSYSFESNIASNDIFRYTIPEFINTGTAPSTYTVSISNVNGEVSPDNNIDDNSWDINFEPIQLINNKGVLVEEGTGMWCGQCVRGTVYIEEMSKRFGKNFAGVAVHNSDPLENSEYNDALIDLGILGYPTVVLFRDELLDPDAILQPIIDELTTSAIAGIDVGAVEANGDLTASVLVTFNEVVNDADYNVSVIITEDNLSFNNDNWNQSNSYSQSGIHMGGFELFPTLVPSKYWPYSHVGRALIGGFEGVNEIIGSFSDGDSKSYTFDAFDLNLGWKKEDLKIIAVLTDQDGKVINVISKKYNDAISDGEISTSTDKLIEENVVSLYPNPTSNNLFIDLNLKKQSSLNIELFNALGQKVISQDFGKRTGFQNLSIDVNELIPGTYILQLVLDTEIVAKKITLN